MTPRTFSHIGISVPDLDAAVKFYSEILGFYVLMQPSGVIEDTSAIGVMCTDVFGPGWERLRIAHLSTGDGIGIELFEFAGQPRAGRQLRLSSPRDVPLRHSGSRH